MATTSPNPFPNNGQRKLSPKEQLQRAKALSCSFSAEQKPGCSGPVHVGVFFDGTGNNREDDHVKSLEKLKEAA